jgi:hypothetical protein
VRGLVACRGTVFTIESLLNTLKLREPRGDAMKLLVWIGIAMVICWGLLWLGIKIAVGAVHLLLLLGVVLIGWGLLRRGRGSSV